jgi:hypothetical protein
MAGLESLETAIQPGVAEAPITAEQTRPADDGWDDDVALGIVLRDASETMAYLNSKALVPVGIDIADDLVRAFQRARQWPDGKPRANLSMHVSLQAIEKIMPALYMSLFGQGKKTPFIVSAKGKTKPEAARANASLLSWAIKGANLKEEMRLMLKTALTYGFCVGTDYWESKEQRKKVYTRGNNGKMAGTEKVEDIEVPMFECLNLKNVLVDPGLRRQDVQAGAKFVCKQIFTDAYGLEDLRDNPDYKNIPTQEELANILATKGEPTEDTLGASKQAVWREFQAQLESQASSKDPLAQPLEILEYTTVDRVVSVLQRKIVIRNNPNERGKLNYRTCAYIDVLGSAWGFGVPRLVGGEQRLQAGVINNWVDSLALTLSPSFQLLKGIGPGTQSIPMSPGKVITESGELKPLVVPDVTKPAMEAIASSDQRANEKVGANGGSNLPNAAMRTAEGVQAFAGDVIQRLQYFLESFINLVYIPTLESFLELMKDHLTVDQVNSILTESEGKAYVGDIAEVYNAAVDVDVIAGSNMMAKFAASQLAPQILQLVTAGPVSDQLEVAGKKFDFSEFVTEYVDLMGWDVENLIVDMTPEDKQRVAQKNAAMIKAQSDSSLQDQKHNDNLSEIDAKAAGQAGVATVRQLLKSHSDAALTTLNNMQNPDSQQNGGAQ